MRSIARLSTVRSLALLVACATPAFAQDDGPTLGWSSAASAGVVAVDGNSESLNVSLAAETEYQWPEAIFSVDLSALRTESTTTTTTAVGTADDFTITEDSTTEVTAESYDAQLGYQHDITDRLYWHAGLGWEKNEFAGIDQRLSAVGGVGYTLWDVDDQRLFKVDAGLTYTQEDLVVDGTNEDFEDDESFLGLRVSWEWMRRLTETTRVGNDTTIDENLDDTDDLRIDTTTWVRVKISERLSLKTSLELDYDAQPAFFAADLVDASGTDTGTDVLVELEELDTVLTVALVVDF